MPLETPGLTLPAPKTDFIGLEGKIHLATGGEPPLLQSHRGAFERFANDKAGGFDGYFTHWRVVDRVRERLATWVGLEAGDIGLVGNASEGIVKVCSSIAWQTGDSVVVSALDYASGRYALSSLQRQGVELRLVPGRAWHLATEDLLAACDDRTRLLYVSQVNALTGQELDLAALSAALEGGPTALMVDVSHALGVVPVDGTLADFLVSCCYKFVLGVHDGILAWNRRRRPHFEPFGAGWRSGQGTGDPGAFTPKDTVERAEFGNAGHLGAYLLEDSLAYLEGFGIDAIAAHTRSLSERMIAGMTDLDLDVMTPAGPENHAANAAFHWPDPKPVVERAAAEDILIWGDNNRIRTSAHLFATADDVERFLDRLPVLLA